MNDEGKNALKESDENDLRDRCFVITPIGGKGEPIRRHIDGIIQAAIEPALEGFGYQVIAAHTMSEAGTIDKQIFKELYEDKLVIANLTQNNPNVMYELAARHCFGKPVIIIAEDGSILPFDILKERTIFYVNDGMGILDLQNRLRRVVKSIDFENEGSPIHDVVRSFQRDAKVYADVESGKVSEGDGTTDREVMVHILEKLEDLETKIQRSTQSQSKTDQNISYYRYCCDFSAVNQEEPDSSQELTKALINELEVHFGTVRRISINPGMNPDTKGISIDFVSRFNIPRYELQRDMIELLERFGFRKIECVGITRRTVR